MFIKLLFRIGLQSFCSDVVVQNVNVISSPTCKVLCFKKHHRVSPIKCFMLETSPFAVTPSTILPTFIINIITTIIIIIIIVIIFNFNITIIFIIIIIIIIIIITIIINPTTVIIILSFVLHFFDIRSSCVKTFLKLSVFFLTTCFFIIYWL